MKTKTKIAIAAPIVALGAVLTSAKTTVYRLELIDEVPYIVGADGYRREVVILSPEQYGQLTNDVIAVIRAMNSTEDGRRKLHGARTGTVVSNNLSVTEYADGFRHSEVLSKKVNKHNVHSGAKLRTGSSTNSQYIATNRISARQNEMRRLMREWSKKEPRQIVVEHDATTGNSEVVK